MQLRVNRAGAVAALALAAGLGGCANLDLDSGGQNWFAKPLDIAGHNAGGYTFSELAETKQHQRPITPNDLVEGNGTCPAPAAQPSPGNQTAVRPDPASLLGGGIALGMSECDVVFRGGQPSAVQIGTNPNGDRTAVLTYSVGPRPGIYHFERGSLMEMDSVAQSSNPPQVPAKKKASAKPQKKSNPS